MNQRGVGFSSFPIHRASCCNGVLTTSLRIQNKIRGLNCLVLLYHIFNLLVIVSIH